MEPMRAAPKAFNEHEPELPESEIERAKSDGQIAISLKGKPMLASTDVIGFIGELPFQ